ncbi:unnamed protein product [Cyclocybe aegerita]|uniref:ADF-H domain-containing protein n=1 Tax=Cyclocybe aegerita TaxID=1973307 RepID=A0A8S0XR83_CYCAE|nr:unnamed protein product [Cyclocybe aegerita]
MALNDPAAVMAAYSSIIDNKNNWLLLEYVSGTFDELGLHSYGNDGLEELKTKLPDVDEVFIAFYREERDVDPGYIIINYVPPCISSVRRARALVHARRVGALFKKHQIIFTIDSLSLLTSNNVHQAIINLDNAFSSPTSLQTTASPISTSPTKLPSETNKDDLVFDPVQSPPPRPLQPMRAPTQNVSKPVIHDMVRRSFTATYAPGVQPPSVVPPVPPLPKGSLFTHLLRRKKRSDDSPDAEDGLPPPTPPKDNGVFQTPQPVAVSYSQPPPPLPPMDRAVRRQRSHSMSEFAVISHNYVERHSDDIVVVEPAEKERTHNKEPTQLYRIPLRGKWSNETTLPSDPAERVQRRRELQKHREREEREALEEEEARQRQLKLQKEALARQEREEEQRRKEQVEAEIRRITAERRRREQVERDEDERKHRELEERKRLDRDRRMEEHRRLEIWRLEQARNAEEAARKAQEARRLEEAERRRKIQQAEAKITQTKTQTALTGWVTILAQDSLSWKRRWYKFVGTTMFLHRSPKDLTTLGQVNLRGNIRALKEWNQGYDDLEAIAFSFVVEFKDERDHWSMYADSEEEKYKLLGLLKVAGGL